MVNNGEIKFKKIKKGSQVNYGQVHAWFVKLNFIFLFPFFISFLTFLPTNI